MTTKANIIRTSAIALTAAVTLAAPLATAPAEAGWKKNKFNLDIHIGPGAGYGGSYVGAHYGYRRPCRWLRRKWLRTGNPKWRWRYKRCMWRNYY